MEDDARRWNQNYEVGRPPWDLDRPPPALIELIHRLPADPMRVLVPCAGLGHDALAWAAAGHHPLAVDFAALAVEGTRKKARAQGMDLEVLEADIFELNQRYKEHFDIVWEQTCLCAVDPTRRRDYFTVMADVLKERGDWYGLLWNHGRAGGPPYDLTLQMIEKLYPPEFELKLWHWVSESVTTRRKEFLVHLQKAS